MNQYYKIFQKKFVNRTSDMSNNLKTKNSAMKAGVNKPGSRQKSQSPNKKTDDKLREIFDQNGNLDNNLKKTLGKKKVPPKKDNVADEFIGRVATFCIHCGGRKVKEPLKTCSPPIKRRVGVSSPKIIRKDPSSPIVKRKEKVKSPVKLCHCLQGEQLWNVPESKMEDIPQSPIADFTYGNFDNINFSDGTLCQGNNVDSNHNSPVIERKRRVGNVCPSYLDNTKQNSPVIARKLSDGNVCNDNQGNAQKNSPVIARKLSSQVSLERIPEDTCAPSPCYSNEDTSLDNTTEKQDLTANHNAIITPEITVTNCPESDDSCPNSPITNSPRGNFFLEPMEEANIQNNRMRKSSILAWIPVVAGPIDFDRQESDLSKLKAMTAKLNLNTRRPSYLEWEKKATSIGQEQDEGDSDSKSDEEEEENGDYEDEGITRFPDSFLKRVQGRKNSKGRMSEDESEEDARCSNRKFAKGKQTVDFALQWVKKELNKMRMQDQALAHQLLSLRKEIQHFKIQKCYMEHKEILDDAITQESQTKDEYSNISDNPKEMFSPTLKELGVTRMNISRRRFSVF